MVTPLSVRGGRLSLIVVSQQSKFQPLERLLSPQDPGAELVHYIALIAFPDQNVSS